MVNHNVAIIIPAYNEAKTIRDVVGKTLDHATHVIVVDDGSTDHTADALSHLPITLIQHPCNRGKAESLMTAFRHAAALPIQSIITLDGDAQHDPADIPRLIAKSLDHPNHVVIGARLNHQEQAPKHRLRANLVADFFISKVCRNPIKDSQSGFRLYPINFIKQLISQRKKITSSKKFAFESELLFLASRWHYQFDHIAIDSYYPPTARPSHYQPIRDTLSITYSIIFNFFLR